MDFESQFKDLVNQLQNSFGETGKDFSIVSLSDFSQILAEAGLHINKFLSMIVRDEASEIWDREFNDKLSRVALSLIEVIDILHSSLCEEEENEEDF